MGLGTAACGPNTVQNSTENTDLTALEARVAQLEADLATAQDEITTLQGQLAGLGTAGTINEDTNPIDWTQLKGVPDLIFCRYENANDTSQVNGGNFRYWSAAECGGVLPDDNYIAAIGEMEIVGDEDNQRAFTDDGMGNGPGMYWFSFNPGQGLRISAVYIPIVNKP